LALAGPLPPPIVWTQALPVADERPLASGQVFELRIEQGEVEAVAGEPGRVVVEATIAPGQSLRWRERSDRLRLTVEDRERLRPRSSTLRLRLPPEADLVLHLGDAGLRLAGVGGQRLRVEGGSGRLRIDSEAANVRIESQTGNIEAALTGGQARLASFSGGIVLRPATGAALDARIATHSGPVEVILPAGAGLDLHLAQVSGEAALPGHPLYVLESGKFYDPAWFYDSPLPARFDPLLNERESLLAIARDLAAGEATALGGELASGSDQAPGSAA